MSKRNPRLIDSRFSGPFTKNGVTVEVYIYRIGHSNWSLEVIDAENISSVWDDDFETDDAAYQEFVRSVDTQGMLNFKVSTSSGSH